MMRLSARVTADLLVIAAVLGLGLFAAALAQVVVAQASTPIDWTQIILALIAGIPAALAGFAAFWKIIQVSGRVDQVEAKTVQVVAKVEEIHTTTNSMSDKLAEAAEKAAAAQRQIGHSEGRDEALTEQRVIDANRASGAAEERGRAASAQELATRTPAITPEPPAPKENP